MIDHRSRFFPLYWAALAALVAAVLAALLAYIIARAHRIIVLREQAANQVVGGWEYANAYQNGTRTHSEPGGPGSPD